MSIFEKQNIITLENSTSPEPLWNPEIVGGYEIFFHPSTDMGGYNRQKTSEVPSLTENVEVPSNVGLKYLYRAAYSKDFFHCLGVVLRNKEKQNEFPIYRTIFGHVNAPKMLSDWIDNSDLLAKYMNDFDSMLKQHQAEMGSVDTSMLFIAKQGDLQTLPGVAKLRRHRDDSPERPQTLNMISMLSERAQNILSTSTINLISLPGKDWPSSLYYRSDGTLTITGNDYPKDALKKKTQIFGLSENEWNLTKDAE